MTPAERSAWGPGRRSLLSVRCWLGHARWVPPWCELPQVQVALVHTTRELEAGGQERTGAACRTYTLHLQSSWSWAAWSRRAIEAMCRQVRPASSAGSGSASCNCRGQAGDDGASAVDLLAEAMAEPANLELGGLQCCTRCNRCGEGSPLAATRCTPIAGWLPITCVALGADAVHAGFGVHPVLSSTRSGDSEILASPAGHDGCRGAKIPKHTKRNPCSSCPASEDGVCAATVPLPERCSCRFCASRDNRMLARVGISHHERDYNFHWIYWNVAAAQQILLSHIACFQHTAAAMVVHASEFGVLMLLQVLARARATEGFVRRAKAAERAYTAQAEEAAEAVAEFVAEQRLQRQERLTWQVTLGCCGRPALWLTERRCGHHGADLIVGACLQITENFDQERVHPSRQRRPDPEEVQAVLERAGLAWSPELVRAKMCPLLLEWDARHPGKVGLRCTRRHIFFARPSLPTTRLADGPSQRKVGGPCQFIWLSASAAACVALAWIIRHRCCCATVSCIPIRVREHSPTPILVIAAGHTIPAGGGAQFAAVPWRAGGGAVALHHDLAPHCRRLSGVLGTLADVLSASFPSVPVSDLGGALVRGQPPGELTDPGEVCRAILGVLKARLPLASCGVLAACAVGL